MNDWIRLHGNSMGTTWAVDIGPRALAPRPANTQLGNLSTAGRCLAGPHPAAAIQAALQAALDNIVDQMSTWDARSTISRLNRAQPGWYQIEPEFYTVMEAALQVAEITEGAYDPTLHELVNLWGFGPAGPCVRPPAPATLRSALLRSGWRKTALNPEYRGVWQPGGLQFDLSSIAKGYGVDAMAQTLDTLGYIHYLVELGGELKARGTNPDGNPWQVGIDEIHLPIVLTNHAAATSGDYRRHFEHNGRRYAHTLDARTGQPLQHALTAVTVIHKQCVLADAWATALLCLGPDAGPKIAEEYGLAALFVERAKTDFKVCWSPAFAQKAGLPEKDDIGTR